MSRKELIEKLRSLGIDLARCESREVSTYGYGAKVQEICDLLERPEPTVDESGQPKRMPIKEFVELGFLQEANRQFFHRHGLALEARFDTEKPDEPWVLSGVWDYRDDPEGVLYADLSDSESHTKSLHVQRQKDKHDKARLDLLGGLTVQPIGDKRVPASNSEQTEGRSNK